MSSGKSKIRAVLQKLYTQEPMIVICINNYGKFKIGDVARAKPFNENIWHVEKMSGYPTGWVNDPQIYFRIFVR
jgi:hypothetical protein